MQTVRVQDDHGLGGAQEKFSTWKRSTSLPILFRGKETEAEGDQVTCTKLSGRVRARIRTGPSEVHLKACSTHCHKNQFCFHKHKQFGNLHDSVQLHQ